MMWQEIIVGICVLAALAFILRSYLFPNQKKNTRTCAGCTGCGDKQEKCR
ncbi:MAG TPA: FeoB-associated Cys-rich membrane protein [Pseudomonadales bacterium]|nr:FeoB-associated Cys-rich membrane protein [Pseudomonadales bacterium]